MRLSAGTLLQDVAFSILPLLFPCCTLHSHCDLLSVIDC